MRQRSVSTRKPLASFAVKARLIACFAIVVATMPASLGRAQDEELVPFPDLVLSWASGEYISPVLCEIGGSPQRIARTLRITPPKRARRRQEGHRFELEPLGVELSCKTEQGEPAPEMRAIGRLRHKARARPDTARHDFEQAMRRDRGFVLQFESGRLEIGSGDDVKSIDLKKGTLDIRVLEPNSDEARMLGDVGPLSKRALTLEAADGTRVLIYSAHTIPRGRRAPSRGP